MRSVRALHHADHGCHPCLFPQSLPQRYYFCSFFLPPCRDTFTSSSQASISCRAPKSLSHQCIVCFDYNVHVPASLHGFIRRPPFLSSLACVMCAVCNPSAYLQPHFFLRWFYVCWLAARKGSEPWLILFVTVAGILGQSTFISSTAVRNTTQFPNITTLQLDLVVLEPDEGPTPSLPCPLRGKIRLCEVRADCLEFLDRFAKLGLEYEEPVIGTHSLMETRSLESALRISTRTVKFLRLPDFRCE